jgi:hypothetical protein
MAALAGASGSAERGQGPRLALDGRRSQPQGRCRWPRARRPARGTRWRHRHNQTTCGAAIGGEAATRAPDEPKIGGSRTSAGSGATILTHILARQLVAADGPRPTLFPTILSQARGAPSTTPRVPHGRIVFQPAVAPRPQPNRAAAGSAAPRLSAVRAWSGAPSPRQPRFCGSGIPPKNKWPRRVGAVASGAQLGVSRAADPDNRDSQPAPPGRYHTG